MVDNIEELLRLKKEASEVYEKTIDRALQHSTYVEKTILWLATTLFGAIFFGVQFFNLTIGVLEILLLVAILIAISVCILSMSSSVYQQQQNIKIYNNILNLLNNVRFRNDVIEENKKHQEREEKSGKLAERCFIVSVIAIFIALVMFATCMYFDVKKINERNQEGYYDKRDK